MGTHHPIRKTVAPEPVVVPDKLYFRIGDVARLCDVPAYVLRFWETEFPQLKPNKGGTGQRLYRRKDVETALRIKALLYDQGYTIPGARQVFKTEGAHVEPTAAPANGIAPVTPVPSVDSPQADIGAQMRQEAQRREHLTSLRKELQSLACQLGASVGTEIAVSDLPPTQTHKPMRPKLVPEPQLEPNPVHLNQGDLFAAE